MVYGQLIKEQEEELNELSILESLDLIQEFKLSSLPKELKLNEDDIINSSKFKSKVPKIIKYMEDNNCTEKQISKHVASFYYGILGTTFYSPNQISNKYQPKIAWLVTYINKYCVDKDKNRIKKDIIKTIEALDKRSQKTELNDLQKAWYNDIKSALTKLK